MSYIRLQRDEGAFLRHYILVCWRDGRSRAEWRFTLVDARTDARWSFRELRALTDLLEAQLAQIKEVYDD